MHPRKPKFSPSFLKKIDRRVLIALVIAVGMVAALSTFAAAPKKNNNNNQKPNQAPKAQQQKPANSKNQNKGQNQAPAKATRWESDGSGAASCKPVGKNQKCEVSPSERAIRSDFNSEVTWKTSPLQAGVYRMSLFYRNAQTLPPANPYRYHIIISINGKKVSEERLTASSEMQRFTSRDLTLKDGVNTVSIKWDNDQAGNGRDANLAWRMIVLDQQQKQPADRLSQTQQEQALAKQTLDFVQKGKVTFPYTPPSGDSKSVLKAISDGKPATVTCHDGSATSDQIKNGTTLNPDILKFLVEAAQKTKVGINAISNGCHMTNSNHYSGQAIDLDTGTGDTGQILEIARKYGGYRNSETTHIHLDFLK